MEVLVYEVLGKTVEVPVIRKSIKNAYLKVKDNQVIMTANKWMSLKELQKFGEFHIEKIILKMEKTTFEYMYSKHEYIYIFGTKCKIEYDQNNSVIDGIVLNGDSVIINESLKEFVDKVLIDFMIKQLDSYVSTSLRNIEKQMGLTTHNYEINKSLSYYGINYVGKMLIKFSYILCHYPHNFIDATIVHELAHTWEPNHSFMFWEIVEKYIPDYKAIRKKQKYLSCNLSAKALTPKELKMLNENLLKD